MLEFLRSEAALISLGSGAMGAFFGAVGAQVISHVAERKNSRTIELNNTRSARVTAFTICNQFLMLKKQLAGPLVNNYMQERKDTIRALQNTFPGIQTKIEININLETLPAQHTLIDKLQDTVFVNLRVRERALACLTSLSTAIVSLNETINFRNELINIWHDQDAPNNADFPHNYYGIKNIKGQNKKYYDFMFGIQKYLDDCIFFSNLLDKELTDHFNKLNGRRLSFFSDYRKEQYTIWHLEEYSNLMPSDEEYENWL